MHPVSTLLKITAVSASSACINELMDKASAQFSAANMTDLGFQLRLEGPDGIIYSGTRGRLEINNSQAPVVSQDSIFQIASITKSFTAVALLELLERQQLDLDTLTIADVMRKFPNGYLAEAMNMSDYWTPRLQIKFKDLLTHSSGLADIWEAKNFLTVFHLESNRQKSFEPKETLKLFADSNIPASTIGTYADTNYIIIGLAIEDLGGKKLQQVFNELIFQPLGLNSTAFAYGDPHMPNSTITASQYSNNFVRDYELFRDISKEKRLTADWASGGLVSNMDDLLTFSKAYYKKGKLVESIPKVSVKNSPRGYGIVSRDILETASKGALKGRIRGHSGYLQNQAYYYENCDLFMGLQLGQLDISSLNDLNNAYEIVGLPVITSFKPPVDSFTDLLVPAIQCLKPSLKCKV